MRASSVAVLLSTISAIAITPAFGALRGNGNGHGNVFDGTKNGNDKGNGKDKGYDEMVHDIFLGLENGDTLDENKVKQLKQKYKQEKLKVNGKKKLFKDTAIKVLEKNKNKGGKITERELVMETLNELTDMDLQSDLLFDVGNGFAYVEDPSTVDPRAGELEELYDPDIDFEGNAELEELYDPADSEEAEDHGRRLGVPVTRNRWANGVVRYKIVFEYSYAGYFMWASRVLPAMAELESLTNLDFVYSGAVWTSSSARADGTVYLRVGSGCSAHIGAPSSGRTHYINIGSRCSHGNILHELLHTAGMHHQQVASYRDKYITVNFANIRTCCPDARPNFYRTTNHGFEFIYDYGSIMHYGEYAFSRNGQKTIDCRGRSCGQRGGLSLWDQWEILYYYWGVYYVNGL